MKVGYARVSTNEQDTHLQIDALKAIGCELIYQEKQSGAKKDRPSANYTFVITALFTDKI